MVVIALAGLVLYNDYLAKVASIEADLYENQMRCSHNYTINM